MGVKGLLLGLNKIGWSIAGKYSECINLSVWDPNFATSKAHSEMFGTYPILAANPFNNDCSDINIFFSLANTDVELLKSATSEVKFKEGAIWVAHSAHSAYSESEYLTNKGLELVSAIIPDQQETKEDFYGIITQGNEKTILKIIGILQMIGQVNIEK